MACRLPGADGLQAFWDLVVSGRTAWGRLPESRFSRDLYFDPEKSKVGKSYSELGGLVSERPADPAVCPIRPDMIDRYDVAHHIFLEVASLACRDAGLDPFAMPGDRRTGVYVGHTGGSTRIGDYVYSTGIDGTAAWLSEVEAARELLGADVAAIAGEITAAVRRDHPGRRPGQSLDLAALGAAQIVNEALRLDGPYLVVDAACASALQALAIAARALREGGIEQAIVGGASYCKSDSLVLFSAAQSVSNTGSCPFGRDADGLVTAEGYVALVLKTLSRAVADGDRIRAVIRGIGVASDGKGKSLWAPRQEGQKLAVERAYPDPREIGRLDYIEAHATSTQVGDATELGALSSLMAAHLPPGRKIPIGSVKANIGHTLETAGMASLVKVVLAMEHGVIPPGSTCSDYNDEFDWVNGPFSVPGEPIAWPKRADGQARRAAVNAFGIGGLNVHLAIAEHLPADPADQSDTRHLRRPSTARGDESAVAIVGMGSVLPGALTLEKFHQLLERGESAIVPVPADRWDASRALDPSGPRTWHTTAAVGGFIQGFAYDWRRHKVPPKQIAAANPLQFMLLEAADAALAEVGGVAALDRIRTAVVVGTMFGGEFAHDLQMGLRLPETSGHLRAALERRGIAARDADRIVQAYGKKVLERMPALVDETGSFTSSTLASRLTKSFDLMGGALALDAGDCSGASALAAAVDMLRQRDCDAVVCAAGQRCLDLMAFEGCSLAKALANGPTSPFAGPRRGRVPGEGAVVFLLKRLADARSAGNRIHGVIRGVAIATGASAPAALRRVARDARLQAGLAATGIAAVEVSGTGLPDVDAAQIRILADEYAGRPAAGAIEGLIGNVGAAAAAAAIVKMTQVLDRGEMPPTVGAGELAEPMRVSATRSVSVPAVDQDGYRAGGVTVLSGNQAAHVVMDNGLPVPAAARETAASVAAASAAPARSRGRVAAIFPGQGSQYTDMFRGLVAESVHARQALETLDAASRAVGFESLAEIAWKPANGLGTVVWDTQWAMYLGDLFAWSVLERMGFSPDVIASHSFGEFPSLVAAGAWSIADGARATRARAAAVEELGPKQGAMLSVIAGRDEVAAAIAPFAGQIWTCAENAPEQSVIGGQARVVDAVEILLEGRRIRSKRLAVPSPFHTPLLAAAADRLAEAIEGLPIVAPARRVYSSTTAAPLTTAEDVRHSLVRQMTQTVRWVDTVEKLWADGVRTFVEVGPSGVLSGLTRRILEGREGAVFIQFDQRSRDAAGHLEKVREALVAVGAIATPSASTTPPAAAGGVLAFDATARRRARNRAGGASTRPTAPVASAERAAPQPREDKRPAAATGHQTAPVPMAAVKAVPESAGGTNGVPATSRFAGVPAPPAASATLPTRTLEQTVAELMREYDVVLPLGRMSDRGEEFLDAARHLFACGADSVAALRRASSPRELCEILARSGGKSNWVDRAGPAAAEGEVASVSAGADTSRDVETFLVDFVVEQTGYPREIVELDADLEGDLGIDSIRKAQLFGEIGQKYGLTADASVSLDDFRTLRHLLDYMLPRVGRTGAVSDVGGPAVGGRNGQASVAGHGSDRGLHEANGHDSHAGHGHGVNGHVLNGAGLNGHGLNGHGLNGHGKPAAAGLATAMLDTAPAAGAVGGDASGLETFLVDFVVEQTGYPREIVELDADLEGDLGIDSIRKAQLFGEIGQKYGLTADASVSLDDFRTLRHLLDYMLPRVGGGHSRNAVVEPAQTGPAVSPDDAAAIRLWAREMARSGGQTRLSVDSIRLPADAARLVESTAAAVGVDAGVLLAALVNPAAALGGCDLAFVADGDGRSGMAIGFGRHAAPSVTPVSADGVSGFLVGLVGLPGGVIAWNDAGLFVAARPAADRAAAATPVMCAVERISCCRSLADAEATARSMAPLAGSVLLVSVVDGAIRELDSDGRLGGCMPEFLGCAAVSPLARVAGNSAGGVAIDRILESAAGVGVRDGLSATCTWLAGGAVAGAAVAFAGGPGGQWLPSMAVESLANFWRPVADRQAAVAAAPVGDEVTARFGLSISALPESPRDRSLAGERVLVLAGVDPAARDLTRQLTDFLTARGAESHVVVATSVGDVMAAIDAAESRAAVRHLVIATPFGAAADWVAARESLVAAGYFACQRWLAARVRAGDTGRSTLTAVTALGGDFGLSGGIGSAVGGGFAGLLKGLAREYPDVRIRVVDLAAGVPAAEVAARVVDEMDRSGPVEVGWQGGRRQTVVAVERPPVAAGKLAALARGSVWLVTGGARGVTAACARALGARHGLTLVLVGSTRPIAVPETWLALDEAGLKSLKSRAMLDAKAAGSDPRQAWREVEKSIEISRELAKFRAAGVAVRYECCDLADAAAVRELVHRVERETGAIRGLVHGAGWESACKFEKKTAAGLESTLGPKCVGLEHVLAAVDPRSLESVVAFGSTSGRLGGLGQADYSLANDMLAKIVGRLRHQRPEARATVFHWHAWDEVGMASRPESRFVLEKFGMKFMPLAEGVGRFLAEIEAGLPESEVLVTERVFCLDGTAAAGPAPVTSGGPAARPSGPSPSLVGAVESGNGSASVHFRLDPSSDRFLLDHLQFGRPLLPAVMGAELLAQAAIGSGLCDRVGEIRGFAIDRPVAFPVNAPRTVRVEVAAGPGAIEARAYATVTNADGQTGEEERIHFRGTVVAGAAEPIAAPVSEPPFPYYPTSYPDDAPMRHGPSLRTLTGLFLDRSGGWARLNAVDENAAAQPRGAGGWTLPIALLDGCIVACGFYSHVMCGQRVEIPVGFERLRLVSSPRLDETCTARLLFRGQDEKVTVYDLVVFGADGRPLLAVDGLQLASMGPERSRSR